jgi:hypothetical protein
LSRLLVGNLKGAAKKASEAQSKKNAQVDFKQTNVQ